MKQIFKLSFLLLALLLPTTATAYDFEVDGIYYNIINDYEAGVTSDDGYYGYSYSGDVTIPETVTYIGTTYSVTSIDFRAFYGCSGLKSVTIPNSVTSIGNYAFSGCSGMTSVTIPNTVTSIGNNAFFNCSALTKVNTFDIASWSQINFENNTANPLYYAHRLFLNNTEVTDLDIPNTVTSISKYAFYNCSGLTSVTIPNSISSISDYTFSGCSGMTSVTIPNTVTSIGKDAFYNCSGLKSVTIPNSVTSIGNYAFQGCYALATLNYNAVSCADFSSTEGNSPFDQLNISIINIGDSVKRIPAYFAYDLTGLTDLTIGNSVTSIGNYAFYNCSGLTSVTIPNSVTSIGKQAFDNCPVIETVTCAATTPPLWVDITMFTTNVYNHTPLYVPSGCERSYMSDQCWGRFATIIGIGMNDNILATGISLNQSQMNLIVGGTSSLIATVLPDSTTNKTVTWMSSHPNVAIVDGNGLVTAVAPGFATITAMTTDGSNLSASCAVTVTENLNEYENYLSLNDTTVMHGDTVVIPIAMTNAESIISFQTDIFLPEGLEIVQEDGEYVIEESSRMTRTHSIISNDVSNGAVRVLCYSSNYKPFMGNSGDDLFYITVKVADDAEGDYTISLRNTLFTTSDFEEIAAPDVAANVKVKAYLLGDANNSGTVTVTDVVVTAQYVIEMNPQPFNFEAADVNVDGSITVTDVSRIAWMVLNPTLNAPLRAPAIWSNSVRMRADGITLNAGETRTASIMLDNEKDCSAFQLDLTLPEGLSASNFRLTGRADSHTFDVNMLANGKTRALCYSPTLKAFRGNEGALLTFDVTATSAIDGVINVNGIELVTTDCQTVRLDDFAIAVTSTTAVNETVTGKAIAKVEYYNLSGQQIDRPESGVTLVVTTYSDGSRTTTKLIR